MPRRDDHDPIREYILSGIATGAFSTGMKLPAERKLTEIFDRPRNAVRETLTVLEAEGKVKRYVGRGTFVARQAPDQPAHAAIELDASPAELLAARLVLEPNLVEAVAANATSADFRNMAACLDAANGAVSLADYEHHDAAFHLAIAEATHNRLLTRIAEMLSAARQSASWGRLKEKRGTLEKGRRRRVRAEHERILSALRERDVDLARTGLRDHLLGVRRNLLGY